ncbi:MAG: UTP--glucose-1-phosphate uridylyltransferase, partial [Moritella sp.]|nr:UTP--glucose-1-phosphate uridylyltransferase [Moritella sp.]
ISGKLHDCGSKLGYMKACVEYGLRNKEFGAELKSFIKALNLD